MLAFPSPAEHAIAVASMMHAREEEPLRDQADASVAAWQVLWRYLNFGAIFGRTVF